MKVLHAAAEVFPLVKTGGLADVVGALPEALSVAGADTRLILPGMPAILRGLEKPKIVCEIGAAFGAARVTLRLGRLAHNGLMAYVVDAPYLFNRAGNPYLMPDGGEWPDNLQRFALLSWAAAHLAAGELDPAWTPDVLHAHDWHVALACAYLANHPSTQTATVYTVHNLAYQGLFPAGDFHMLGLPAKFMVPGGLEFHGQFSFMKAGLKHAHRVTTVSPNYAREIATDEFGCGLNGLIRSRGAEVTGILNGVDRVIWNPETDPLIAATYRAQDLSGKALCKAALQREMGLRVDPHAPLLAVVSRLTSQKGLDLLLAALPTLLHDQRAHPAQLVVQGSGDVQLEAAFKDAAAAYSGRVAVNLAYDEALAHRVIAGADAMLVPSRFEPCGLTQLYALRYGTVPIVRNVGGLADTVVDASHHAVQADTATGFLFDHATAPALAHAMANAIHAYHQPDHWQRLMRRGMAQNFSWAVAAEQYLALYQDALSRPHPGATG